MRRQCHSRMDPRLGAHDSGSMVMKAAAVWVKRSPPFGKEEPSVWEFSRWLPVNCGRCRGTRRASKRETRDLQEWLRKGHGDAGGDFAAAGPAVETVAVRYPHPPERLPLRVELDHRLGEATGLPVAEAARSHRLEPVGVAGCIERGIIRRVSASGPRPFEGYEAKRRAGAGPGGTHKRHCPWPTQE